MFHQASRIHSGGIWVVFLKTPLWHETEGVEGETENECVGGGGLGLVLQSCGKIPRTFSPTPTHNTQMEEKRKAWKREGSGVGRSLDKSEDKKMRKDKKKGWKA